MPMLARMTMAARTITNTMNAASDPPIFGAFEYEYGAGRVG
jgi:hypothetical protein